MKSHSVKSNAKRAARQLAEQHPGFVAAEPVLGTAGQWLPALDTADGRPAAFPDALREHALFVGTLPPAPPAHEPPTAGTATPGGKTGRMLEMLLTPAGATVAEIGEAFGWQAHTTRAAISVQTRKATLVVATEKVDGRGRVYRATPAPAAVT